MNRGVAVSTVAGFLALSAGSLTGWSGFAGQFDPTYRAVSGIAVASLIAGQWALTLGRTVFERTGRSWDRWVQVHHLIGLVLPLAVWAHSPHFGYGLLAALPLALFASAWFGTRLSAGQQRWLPWHVGLAGLTAAMTLVHLYMVVAYN